MKQWYSAAELADLDLPGLPGTERNVRALADRKGWNAHTRFARQRAGRGGGMEYRIEILPLEARMALLARYAEPDAGADAVIAAPDPAPGTASAAIVGRDARLFLIGMFNTWHRGVGLGKFTAVATFCDLYNAGRVGAPEWVQQAIRSVSKRTMWRWLGAAREGAVDRLAVDRGAARRGKGVLDEALDGAIVKHMLVLVAHQPHLSADHVRTLCRDRFGDEIEHHGRSVPMPSVRAFQSVLKRLKTDHRAELLALHNPDAFKSRMRVSGSSAHRITRLNELWQIDASPADALCKDGRHSIYVCVDVFSRRMIVSVSRTPRADAVGLLLKKALMAWGVPERIKTDNGSDFVARATRRLLAALRIETETSAPFSPEQKGVVERAIGTLQRDFMPLLPGFIGHSVADRKAIESRKAFSARLGQDDARAFQVDLTAGELSDYLDRLVEDRYHHKKHGGIGTTPFQKAASHVGTVRKVESEAALAVLLAPVAGKDGLRTYGKQGLRIDGAHYLTPSVMPGETVFVRMDPADMGRAFLFGEDGETFRAIAVCPELAGVDPAAALAAAQAAQKAFIAERVAPIRKEAAKIKPRDMVDAVARQAAKDAGKLTEFPRRTTIHSTPALAGARMMSEARETSLGKQAPSPSAPSAAEREMLARIEAEAAADRAPVAPVAEVRPLRKQETSHQRFRRALALEMRISAGETIATEDALWLGSYRDGAEYRGLKGLYEQFGDAALR